MKKSLLLLPVFVLAVLTGCHKNDQPAEHPDVLTVEENQIVENLPAADSLQPELMILPNDLSVKAFLQEVDTAFYRQWNRLADGSQVNGGLSVYDNLGPQDARNYLIAQLSLVARNYMDRAKHQYSKESDTRPLQNGIAYSYGSRDLNRKKPPFGECRDFEIVGLDCSGFLYQLFYNAGIVKFSSATADQQRNPATIEKAIKESVPSLNKVKVEDLGLLATDKMQEGDIIYWKTGSKAFHIGLIINYNGQLIVAQSNGTGSKDGDCDKNLGTKRGPRVLKLNDPYWFGTSKVYSIVRINADISGKYDFRFACMSSSTDFFSEELNFPTNTNSSFHLEKAYTDLDGSSNVAKFDFTYDHETNVLKCSVINTDGSLPSFQRKDNFTKKITRDKTGYFPMTNEYIHNGTGCQIKVSLVNKE